MAVDTEPIAVELRKEATTMALYVAVCLLAALAAVAEDSHREPVDVVKIVWGTTIGLAIAHWFAFRVSARLVSAGEVSRHDAAAGLAQIAGAALVALLATIPVVLPDEDELDVTRHVLAAFIGLVSFRVARNAGAGVRRSVVYALLMLLLATGVALLKNRLAGH